MSVRVAAPREWAVGVEYIGDRVVGRPVRCLGYSNCRSCFPMSGLFSLIRRRGKKNCRPRRTLSHISNQSHLFFSRRFSARPRFGKKERGAPPARSKCPSARVRRLRARWMAHCRCVRTQGSQTPRSSGKAPTPEMAPSNQSDPWVRTGHASSSSALKRARPPHSRGRLRRQGPVPRDRAKRSTC